MNKYHSALIGMDCEDIDRFWSYVQVMGPAECWPWLLSCRNKDTYGVFYLWDKSTGSTQLTAHRVALFLVEGLPDPVHLHSCHTCDNPPCCNPSHLFYGTRSDNMSDAANKGRLGVQKHPEQRRGELNGRAKLTGIDAAFIRSSGLPRREIMNLYGMSKAAVCKLLAGKTYA